jgi:hypothetical protein
MPAKMMMGDELFTAAPLLTTFLRVEVNKQ